MAYKPYQFDPTQVPQVRRLTTYDLAHALNFNWRSPMTAKVSPGLPPATQPIENITYQGDQVYVGNAPLAPLNVTAQTAVMTPPSSPTPPPTISVNDGAKYGDAITLVATFTGAGDLLVLPRPSTKRTLLIIENDLVAPNTIRINFDAQASANLGLRVINGGNAFFDIAVPQNDIHVFAPVAGNVIVTYINSPVNLQ
jgi:hypothetical protein